MISTMGRGEVNHIEIGSLVYYDQGYEKCHIEGDELVLGERGLYPLEWTYQHTSYCRLENPMHNKYQHYDNNTTPWISIRNWSQGFLFEGIMNMYRFSISSF